MPSTLLGFLPVKYFPPVLLDPLKAYSKLLREQYMAHKQAGFVPVPGPSTNWTGTAAPQGSQGNSLINQLNVSPNRAGEPPLPSFNSSVDTWAQPMLATTNGSLQYNDSLRLLQTMFRARYYYTNQVSPGVRVHGQVATREEGTPFPWKADSVHASMVGEGLPLP